MPRLHPVRCAISLLLLTEGAVVFLLLRPHFPSLHSSPRPMTSQHRASSAPTLNCTISLDHCREDDDHDDHDHHNTNFGDRCSLKELTKDCESFLRAHRYMDTGVRREEREFALAFSVRMHRSPRQAEQLLRAIYRPHNFYCIHVDAKAEAEVYDAIAAVGMCVPNVTVLRDRVVIRYGVKGNSIVRADLKCMRAALDSEVPWKYLLTLSGEEFPLRTNLEMVRILKLFRGANDLEMYPLHERLTRWINGSVVSRGDVYRNGKLTLNSSPDKLQFRVLKGSAYGSFSRQYVEAVLEDRRAQTILQWFNDTFAPEELVWASINALPAIPGGYSLNVKHSRSQQASRAVVWRWDPYKCKGGYRHSVCVFTKDDLPWLKQQPQLMANKFMVEKDSRVLHCLEARLFHRAISGHVAVDYAYFESLPHVKLYREHGHSIVW